MTQQKAGNEREERADNDNRTRRPAAPVRKAASNEPQKPGMRQRWGAAQASKTAVFWFLAAAIVLTMIIGFTWGGWVTAGSAQATANTTAGEAVITRLAPICVAQFNQDPLKDERFAELQAMSSYQRGAFVREQGWATMPGEDGPDRKVADACARLLMEN